MHRSSAMHRRPAPFSGSLLQPSFQKLPTCTFSHAAHSSTSSRAPPAAAAAAVQPAAPQPSTSASSSGLKPSGPSPAPKIKLQKQWRGINWDRWIYLMSLKPVLVSEEEEDEEDPLNPDAAGPNPDADSGAASASREGAASSSFFSHWDNPASHLAYLQDEVLTSAFREALTRNGELLRDKVVLDLGCGPGHLAMMCAQAGAKRVYAVDGSAATVEMAKQVIGANGLSSKITVIHSSGEELQLKEQVDVIVCDSVGPMLLGGGLMRALAMARRTLLKPGGIVLPDEASLFVAGVDDRDFLMSAKQQWQKVAGFDMTPAMVQVAKTPRLDTLVRSSQLFTSRCRLAQVNLGPGGDLTLKKATQQGFSAPFTIQAQREERLFALMVWVQAAFTCGGKASSPVVFSADPSAPTTHQRQLLLNFPKSIRMAQGDTLSGTIHWRPSPEDPRGVEVEVDVEYKGVAAAASYSLPPLMASLAAGAAVYDE